jgi:hypothetical protein
MKREQAGAFVFDGDIDRVGQRRGGRVDIVALHEPCYCRQPFARFEPRFQDPDPASGLVERRRVVHRDIDPADLACLLTHKFFASE